MWGPGLDAEQEKEHSWESWNSSQVYGIIGS